MKLANEQLPDSPVGTWEPCIMELMASVWDLRLEHPRAGSVSPVLVEVKFRRQK